MSTHVLDTSGARPLSTMVNDPARTHASVSAKAGDDVRFQVGSAREVRVAIPPNAKVQKRRYVSRSQVMKGGRPVKDESGEFVYEERPYESLYLVWSGTVVLFARSSYTAEQIEALGDDAPSYELTPHTSLYAKRNGDDLDFSESGELLAEVEISELFPEAAE